MRNSIFIGKNFPFPELRTLLPILVALILLMQFPSLSRAQEDYIPLAVEGAQWIVAYNHISSPWLVDDLWEYYADGDTSLNGEVYKKIYIRQLVVTQDLPPFEPDGGYELKGFIREDPIERVVYAIDLDSLDNFCPSNEEFLMFDFSLTIGDTADFCLIPEFLTGTVDTVYAGAFFGFETWFYSFFGEGCFEGIGSTYGLFEPMFTPFKKSYKKYIQYTYLYYYCRESPCDLIVSIQEETSVKRFSHVYPNPATNILNIKLRTAETSGEISLFSIYGLELMQIKAERNKNEYSLDLSGLPAGNYILTYEQEGVVVDTEKVIVSR